MSVMGKTSEYHLQWDCFLASKTLLNYLENCELTTQLIYNDVLDLPVFCSRYFTLIGGVPVPGELELEIPYEIKPVSLVKGGGEQHCNEFREVNPMEQVPALHIDNHTLIESLNILQYLEETRPHRPLMPADPVKRARVREICDVIATGIQPLQNLVVLIYVGEERKKEWAQHWITRGFTAVEKLLSSSAGKYCVGDDITLADCCLVPQIFSARRFHVDLRPFPTILRVDRHLENHPAFTAAHPNNQPDCPPEATK